MVRWGGSCQGSEQAAAARPDHNRDGQRRPSSIQAASHQRPRVLLTTRWRIGRLRPSLRPDRLVRFCGLGAPPPLWVRSSWVQRARRAGPEGGSDADRDGSGGRRRPRHRPLRRGQPPPRGLPGGDGPRRRRGAGQGPRPAARPGPAGRVHARHRRLHRGRQAACRPEGGRDRKSTRLNSSHVAISYAVFCLKKKKKKKIELLTRKKKKKILAKIS